MPVPIDLIMIIIVTLCSYFFDFDKQLGMRIVKHIPTG